MRAGNEAGVQRTCLVARMQKTRELKIYKTYRKNNMEYNGELGLDRLDDRRPRAISGQASWP